MRELNGFEMKAVSGGLTATDGSWEEGWECSGGGGGGGGGSSFVEITLASVTIVETRDWCGTTSFPAPEAPLGNDFSLICKAHDGCIDLGTSREICDAEMKQAMADECATDGNVLCGTAALIYGKAIDIGTNISNGIGETGNPMGDGWGGN